MSPAFNSELALPDERRISALTRAFERRAQLPPQIGFVFDDQNAHSMFPGAVRLRAVNPSSGEKLLVRNNWEVSSKCQLKAGSVAARAANHPALAIHIDPDDSA